VVAGERRSGSGARDAASAREAARRLLPRLVACSRWFRTARDPRSLGLVAVLHPWETGMDNSPAWDEALARVEVAPDLAPYVRRDTSHVDAAQRPTRAEYDRYLSLVHLFRGHGWDPAVLYDVSPFRVADVGVNALRLGAERDLAWLADDLGEPGLRAEAEAVAAEAEQGFARLWHEADGCYRSRDLVADAPVPVSTSAGFLAFAAGGLEPGRAARLAGTFDRWLGTVAYGLPSLPADAPAFDRRRYWRGPVWAIVNFMVAEGLKARGMADRAARLRADTARLIRGAGFAEYFDPLDGAGLGGGAFSWTAAMWLAWAGRGSPWERRPAGERAAPEAARPMVAPGRRPKRGATLPPSRL
jgi:alpha,alpha-trehalase